MAINRTYVVFALFFVALAVVIPLAVVLSNKTDAKSWTLLDVLPTASDTLLPSQVDYSDGASVAMNNNGSRIVVATTQSPTRVFDPIPGSTGKYRQMGDDLPGPSVVAAADDEDATVNPLVTYPNVVAMSGDGTTMAIAHPAAASVTDTAANLSDTAAAALEYTQFYGYVQVYSLQYVEPPNDKNNDQPMLAQILPLGSPINPTLAAGLWQDHVDLMQKDEYDAILAEYMTSTATSVEDNNVTSMTDTNNSTTTTTTTASVIPASAMDSVPKAMQFGQSTAMNVDGTRIAVGVQIQTIRASTKEVSYSGFIQVWQRDPGNSSNTTQWKPLGIPMKGVCSSATNDDESVDDRCVPCSGSGQADFGTVLAMNQDGTRIATAAPQLAAACDKVPNYMRGFVRVYELVDSSQLQFRQMGPDIVLPDAFAGQTDCPSTEGDSSASNSTCTARAFGSSISISLDGSTVAVGSNYGAVVLVWNENDSNWVQRGTPLSLTGSNIYTRVSLGKDGSRVAISSPYTNKDNKLYGLAAVYDWQSASTTGAGTWVQVADTIEHEDQSEALQGYGSGLALAADTGAVLVAAGSPGEGTFVYGDPQ